MSNQSNSQSNAKQLTATEKAQIADQAASLASSLQPRSGKFRTISPEMDPLRLGSG